MHNDMGWVTFHTIRTADGRVLLVQKRDGSTRTIATATRAGLQSPDCDSNR